MSRVKVSNLAGRWYAADAAHLQAEVDALLRGAAPAHLDVPLTGLVVPHAAYRYSGRAAAAGYACIADADYERVAILAPSHFSWFRGVALADAEAFTTPLGRVAVDEGAVAALAREPLFAVRAEAYADEHSLEIQLPFLQRVLPGARLVPLLVGDLASGDERQIAGSLRALADVRTVFVISSDFVHYGHRFDYVPFPSVGADEVRNGLRQLDGGAIDRVCAADAPGFRRYVAETGATICGRHPISLFLTMLEPPVQGTLLAYYTSLDVTGDYEHSVSYVAIAFPR
jgi:AmmeMemoRadiSam system protein B